MDWTHELNTARRAAALAAVIQRDADRDRLAILRKTDASPVTDIDRRCEDVIRETLATAFPDDGFLGEETGRGAGRSGRTWIVDPLDGTRPFIRGIPTFSCLIALEAGDEPVVGVMAFPALATTYWAARGAGAFRDGRPVRVSTLSRPEQALGSGCGYIQRAGTARADALLRLMGQWDYAYGFMDALTYGLIAEGAVDVCVNLLDQPWDCAAAACIVREAGGRFSDLDGRPTVHGDGMVLSNDRLHDATLATLCV